jgi:hypothetical protein
MSGGCCAAAERPAASESTALSANQNGRIIRDWTLGAREEL